MSELISFWYYIEESIGLKSPAFGDSAISLSAEARGSRFSASARVSGGGAFRGREPFIWGGNHFGTEKSTEQVRPKLQML